MTLIKSGTVNPDEVETRARAILVKMALHFMYTARDDAAS